MSNNTTEIKISRSATPQSSRSNAILALNNYNFRRGELVAVTYNTSTNTTLNVIFAVGIEDGKGKYKIVSLLQNRIVRGVLYSEPRNKADYLWTNGETWYLGEEPLSLYPGIIINDINSQTFFAVSSDGQPRQINNVYDRGELIDMASSIVSSVVQSDWLEEDTSALSYIKNKPEDLSTFTEDIIYRLTQVSSEDDNFIKYNLTKTIGNNEPVSIGDTINIPFDSSMVSGTVEIVTAEDKQIGGKFYEEDEYNIGDYYLDLVILIGTNLVSHIYILADFISDSNYVAGLGINIENKNISLKIIERSGLRVDSEKGLTIDPVNEYSSGAMTAEMKEKLDFIVESDYVKVLDITEGNIEPKISKTTNNIESPPSDYKILETRGFFVRPCIGIEAGNGEILQINGGNISYDSKNSVVLCYPKIKSVGNNACNPANIIAGYKIDSTGEIIQDNSSSISMFYCLATPYSIFSKSNENIIVGFSKEKSNVLQVLEKDKRGYYIPPSNGYIYISTSLNGVPDLCARISGDGLKDNVFEEYTERIIDLGVGIINNRPEDFITPYIISLNGVSDSINNIEGSLYCTKRIGEKIIESLDWGNVSSVIEYVNDIPITRYYYEFHFQQEDLDTVKSNTEAYIIEELVDDDTWRLSNENIIPISTGVFRYYIPFSSTTPKTIKIIYELDQPITFNIEVNSTYPVYEYGTEFFGESNDEPKPTSIRIRYKPNLLSDLIHINNNINKKIGKQSVDNQMSDSSKNPVQCSVVKEYVDSLIGTYSTEESGDLSKQDFYGNPKLMNTSNCYIITKYTTSGPNNTYRFPLVYGNAIKNGVNNEKSYTTFVDYLDNNIISPWIDSTQIETTGILWKDDNSTVSSPYIITTDGVKYISFSANSGDGNAVIYLKDQQNRIVWTWHIWEINNPYINISNILNPISLWNVIPENGPTSGTEYYMMPVYLGFTGNGTSGVYYQWGRKDPFSLSSSTIINHSKSTTGNAIQNPQTLFLGNKTWNNLDNILNYWDYNSSAPNSFCDYNTGKTIYDPCPIGWKVPNSNVFRGFTTTGTQIGDWNIKGSYRPGLSDLELCGFDFKHNYEDNQPTPNYPLFQAIGYQEDTIIDTGTHGYYWSSVLGCSLEFSENIINPRKSNTSISLGFPIHPILE